MDRGNLFHLEPVGITIDNTISIGVPIFFMYAISVGVPIFFMYDISIGLCLLGPGVYICSRQPSAEQGVPMDEEGLREILLDSDRLVVNVVVVCIVTEQELQRVER